MHSGPGLWFLFKSIIWNQTFITFTRNCLLLKFTVLKYVVSTSIRNKNPDLKFLLFDPSASLTFLSFLVIEFSQKSLRPVVLLLVCYQCKFIFFCHISTLWNGNAVKKKQKYWFSWMFFMSLKYSVHTSSCILVESVFFRLWGLYDKNCHVKW